MRPFGVQDFSGASGSTDPLTLRCFNSLHD